MAAPEIPEPIDVPSADEVRVMTSPDDKERWANIDDLVLALEFRKDRFNEDIKAEIKLAKDPEEKDRLIGAMEMYGAIVQDFIESLEGLEEDSKDE